MPTPSCPMPKAVWQNPHSNTSQWKDRLSSAQPAPMPVGIPAGQKNLNQSLRVRVVYHIYSKELPDRENPVATTLPKRNLYKGHFGRALNNHYVLDCWNLGHGV